MAKENVKISKELKWDDYFGKDPSDALKEIYSHVNVMSLNVRDWYWKSISIKKNFSLLVRSLAFILLVCGAVLPILAGIFNEVDCRLKLTQFGVASLAIAGLLEIADRIFGWSTGWLRYIKTAMGMEDRTRKFQLEWANYMNDKIGSLTENDKKPLFTLAKQFLDDIYIMQIEETDKWVAEFINSTAVLRELIKTQRESADKSYSEAKEKQKAQEPGAIELTVIHKTDTVPIKIAIDDQYEKDFTGTVWSKVGLAPGIHQIQVNSIPEGNFSIKIPLEVKAGKIEKLEVKLP